jgi:enoyl-[acyl-carrier protein] reductase I
MSFLKLEEKKILIFGVSNRKSVAYFIAKTLQENGAELIFSVQNEKQETFINKSFPTSDVYICDVRDEDSLLAQYEKIKEKHKMIYGLIHSIAFANFSEGLKPFHKTLKRDFLEATEISCFSFIQLAGIYKEIMEEEGAILTISISSTKMAAPSYGYMAPIKAGLDSSVVFLAKSLSEDTKIRVNAVGASLLKTSASAGIPGYIEPYLYAEQVIPRKEALKTQEVADVATFLMSPTASGVNAQTVIVDAGMAINFFDKEVVSKVVN